MVLIFSLKLTRCLQSPQGLMNTEMWGLGGFQNLWVKLSPHPLFLVNLRNPDCLCFHAHSFNVHHHHVPGRAHLPVCTGGRYFSLHRMELTNSCQGVRLITGTENFCLWGWLWSSGAFSPCQFCLNAYLSISHLWEIGGFANSCKHQL